MYAITQLRQPRPEFSLPLLPSKGSGEKKRIKKEEDSSQATSCQDASRNMTTAATEAHRGSCERQLFKAATKGSYINNHMSDDGSNSSADAIQPELRYLGALLSSRGTPHAADGGDEGLLVCKGRGSEAREGCSCRPPGRNPMGYPSPLPLLPIKGIQ